MDSVHSIGEVRPARVGVLVTAKGNATSSACEALPHSLPEALMPQDRYVAAMQLGANALGHDEGADRISSRAGADHPGGSSHRRVVVLVAQPLPTWPGRRRLGSASFTPHAGPTPVARNRGGQSCTRPWPHHDTVHQRSAAGSAPAASDTPQYGDDRGRAQRGNGRRSCSAGRARHTWAGRNWYRPWRCRHMPLPWRRCRAVGHAHTVVSR